MNHPDETAERPAPSRERLRREAPAREHPVRGAATMFRPAEAERPAEAHHRAEARAVDGAVERAVSGAYRVIEDHLRRGREAARTQGAQPPMTNATSLDPQEITRKITRYWTDMMFMWLELVTPLAGAVGERARPTAEPFPVGDDVWRVVQDGDAPAAGPRVKLAAKGAPVAFEVELVAAQRARVRLSLDGPAGAPMGVRKLRTDDDEETALDAVVTLTADEQGAPRLSITIHGQQPAGTYVGVVFRKDSKVRCGELTLELSA